MKKTLLFITTLLFLCAAFNTSYATSASSKVCAGSTVTLTDSRPSGTWNATNTTFATVSAGGVVTGLSGGMDTVLYTASSINDTFIITIGNVTGVAVSSVTPICYGLYDTVVTLTFIDTTIFNATGALQSWVVPAGVTAVTFDVQGSRGGQANVAPPPGLGNGGRVQGNLQVTAGEVLYIYVGNTNGYNGGGAEGNDGFGDISGAGGGASDIRIGGIALANRVVVAGGGGGASTFSGLTPGDGGNLFGGDVLDPSGVNSDDEPPATGGTQTAGGQGGYFDAGDMGAAGGLGYGGNGNNALGAGGGGGYYGGGGGFNDNGAGGSSYIDTPLTSNVIMTQGYNTGGNGKIILYYNQPSLTYNISWDSATRALGFVNVISKALPDTSQLNIAIPGNAPAGTYTCTFTVNDSTDACNPAINNTVSITVKPLPDIAISHPQQLVCNNSATVAEAFTSSFSGNTYTWANDDTAIHLAAAGSGSTIATFTAKNTSSVIDTAIITVTATATNGCTAAVPFDIIVNPTPIVTVPANDTVCSGIADTFTFSSAVSGATYTWANNRTTTGLASSGSGDSIIFTPNNSTAAAITSTITVIPAANSCNGIAKSFILNVKPLPSVITGTLSLPAGTMSQLADATTGGSWTTANTAIATINNTGTLVGLANGTSLISYSVNSCVTTSTVNVSTAGSALQWYSNATGGDASVLANWWSSTSDTGYQPIMFSTPGVTWIVNSNMTSTAPLTFVGNVAIAPGGTFTPLLGSTTTVGGNWSNAGSFIHNGGIVLFNGANTANLSDTLSGTMTGSNQFNNITFSSPSLSYAFTSSVDVAGDFVQSAGTVTAPSGNLAIGGNFTHTAGNFIPNGGTVTMNGNSSTLTVTGMTTAGTNCFNNLSFNAPSASSYTISGDLLLTGNFTNLTPNGTIDLGSHTLTVGGNWSNPGPFTIGAGHQVIYNKTGSITVSGNQ